MKEKLKNGYIFFLRVACEFSAKVKNRPGMNGRKKFIRILVNLQNNKIVRKIQKLLPFFLQLACEALAKVKNRPGINTREKFQKILSN